MSFKLAHITDTHLSAEKPFFVENFDRVVDHLQASAPDLVVNTGDVSLNGADLAADLAAARRMHDEIGLPWLAIPGNHDVGDNQEIARKQPFDRERRSRWLSAFGEDFWVRDVPGWRLLGINSLLLGSSLPEAAEQEAFIESAAAEVGERSLALFLHKPLFIASSGEEAISGHWVNPLPRRRLYDALGEVRPILVCCGHRHEYRDRHDELRQIWGPGTSFTVPDWLLATEGGIHTVGYVQVELAEDGTASASLVQPSGVIVHNLEDFPGAYGDLRANRPAAA